MATDRDPEAQVAANRRVGLFGGTFDPPHNAHVSVARDVADALRLDRVLWIPVGEPPHKDAWQPSAACSRLAMVRAAASVDDRFEVSAIEVERSGPSYTVDTVRTVRAEMRDADLFLIIGVDQYRAFDAWRDPAGILEHARLAVMDRVGESARSVCPDVLTVSEKHVLDESRGADEIEVSAGPPVTRVVFAPVERIDLSSTEIRNRVRAGDDVSRLLPPSVLEIIEREGLYRASLGGTETTERGTARRR